MAKTAITVVADSRVAVFAIFCVWARLPLWQNLKTTIDMRQNTNEILAENARRCAILRNASRPPRPLTGHRCLGERRRFVDAYRREYMLPASLLDDPQFDPRRLDASLRDRHDFEFWLYRHFGGFVLDRPSAIAIGSLMQSMDRGEAARGAAIVPPGSNSGVALLFFFTWLNHLRYPNRMAAYVYPDGASRDSNVRSLLHIDKWHPETLGFDDCSMRMLNTVMSASDGTHMSIHLTMRNSQRLRDYAPQMVCMLPGKLRSAKKLFKAYHQFAGTSVEGSVCALVSSPADARNKFYRTAFGRGIHNLRPLFIPWYADLSRRIEVADKARFVEQMCEEQWRLWDLGLTLEQINWYNNESLYNTPSLMREWYPALPSDMKLPDIHLCANPNTAIAMQQAIKAATAELEQPQPATAVKPRRIQRPPRIAKPRSEATRHSRMRIAMGAVNTIPSAKAVAWIPAASPPPQLPPMLLSG